MLSSGGHQCTFPLTELEGSLFSTLIPHRLFVDFLMLAILPAVRRRLVTRWIGICQIMSDMHLVVVCIFLF